jgi:hypothetical protein
MAEKDGGFPNLAGKSGHFTGMGAVDFQFVRKNPL